MRMFQFIDANCMLGQRLVVRAGSLKNTEEIAAFMDSCGIAKAIVYHCTAKENVPDLGNHLLEDEIAQKGKTGQFIKQWVVMPDFWGEFMPPAKLLSRMKEQGVTSVRMYPDSHGYSIEPYASGRLIEALSECKVPIFIEQGQLGSWDGVYRLCQNYPAARFVLVEPGYRCARYLAPILDTCSNLWVDTSNLLMHNGLREVCKYHGAHRLIFGSGAPVGSMAAAVSLIRYADLSKEEKSLIASDNINKLLKEVCL